MFMEAIQLGRQKFIPMFNFYVDFAPHITQNFAIFPYD